MSNKLRNIFQNKDDFLKANIQFDENSTAEAFTKALEKAYQEGKTGKIGGAARISFGLDSGASLFPLECIDKVTDLVIGPAKEPRIIVLDIDGGKFDFSIECTQVEDGVIVETKKEFIFYTKIFFDKSAQAAKVNIEFRVAESPDVNNILKSIKLEKAFLQQLFSDNLKNISELGLAVRQLDFLQTIYEKLHFIEETFKRKFIPAEVNLNDMESQHDLYELWILLKEKEPVRLNAKLKVPTATDSMTMLMTDKIIKNHEISMTFMSRLNYSIWGETINLYAANLLSDAIVKSIEHIDGEKIRVHYGEKETRPMYISYKGFIEEEEAKKEINELIKHKEEYENAKTIEMYMQQAAMVK